MFLFPFLKRNNEIRNALSKFPRFHPRTQENIDISAYDSIGPSSILPITRFLRGSYVNSDYFVLLRIFYDLIYQQATAPRELRMRNANPRPADEAEETGLSASVFRFPKHETPKNIRWSVSRNETPAKIVFRFCCFITDMIQLWPYWPHTSKCQNARPPDPIGAKTKQITTPCIPNSKLLCLKMA